MSSVSALQTDGQDGERALSSIVREHEPEGSQSPLSYLPGCYYLLSPLSSWEGDLAIGDDYVHRGAIRPGMLRLASSTDREQKFYPKYARALVIQIPEHWFNQTFAILDARYESHAREFQPILHVDTTVRRLARILAEKRPRTRDANLLLTEGVTKALLGLLIDHNRKEECPVPSHRAETLTEEQMLLLCTMVDRNLERPPSLKSLADFLDVTPVQLSRRFYRKNGTTPYAWLLERRIRHAQYLLGTTEIPVTELALRLGFANQSHFTEAFRSRVGISPVRWRNQDH